MNMEMQDARHIIDSLRMGLRTDCNHLYEQESDLAVILEMARQFGVTHGRAAGWSSAWDQRWVEISGILRRTREAVDDMDRGTQTSEGALLDGALLAWDKIQIESGMLVTALGAVRQQAMLLDRLILDDWNAIAQGLEPHLTKLHTCARVLRIRVELQRFNSKEGVDGTVQRLLSRIDSDVPEELPKAVAKKIDLQAAAHELQQEKHESGGLMDVVKALLMRVETPEERMQEKRALKEEKAES